MLSCFNLVNELLVCTPVYFTFDSDDIQIFDLKTNKELVLNYNATREFFRDVPFTYTLDVDADAVVFKDKTLVKSIYNTSDGSISLYINSDCNRYLVRLNISYLNVKCDYSTFGRARYLHEILY